MKRLQRWAMTWADPAKAKPGSTGSVQTDVDGVQVPAKSHFELEVTVRPYYPVWYLLWVPFVVFLGFMMYTLFVGDVLWWLR